MCSANKERKILTASEDERFFKPREVYLRKSPMLIWNHEESDD
jgi:hypothetical protein